MLTIKVEFDAGEDISDAFQAAISMADKLDCRVQFKFNDVTCSTLPGGSVKRGVDSYTESLGLKTPYKFARSH